MNEFKVSKAFLTGMLEVINAQEAQEKLIEDQGKLIDSLMSKLEDIAEAENYLRGAHGDFSIPALQSAADFVSNSPLRHSLPEIWIPVTMHVFTALREAYKEKNSKRRSEDLYIMESASTGAVKIGRTSVGAGTRVKQLKTSCPDIKLLKVFEGHGQLEAEIHKKFAHVRRGGEWFEVSPDYAEAVILEKIRNACTDPEDCGA